MLRSTLIAACGLLLWACGDDDGTTSGNNTHCTGDQTCHNDCSAEMSTCNMNCDGSSSCSATCRAGQSCSFTCEGSAECDFDCSEGTCTVSGGSEGCACSGDCAGTCGGGACDCGAPTDPGYAACVAACS